MKASSTHLLTTSLQTASAVSGRQITVEEMDWKTFTVYLPYVNGLPKRIEKICDPYNLRTIFEIDYFSKMAKHVFLDT